MSSARAAAIAGIVGFAVMSIELTAVRLMAPHFGDSAYVWTNVIGVMLVALALGAWLGGRAARTDSSSTLSLVLIVGGLAVAISPWLADPIGRWLLPEGLLLDAAMGALVRGSLAATVVLFALPVGLAGMATPMLVATLVGSGRAVGPASGHVAAWSTLGSLVGTFATTHWLVPELGSRLSLTACAFGLIVAGVTARAGRRAVVAIVPFALAWISGTERDAFPDRDDTVAEVESGYQYLRVAAQEDAGQGLVQLQINEGLDSFHSISRSDTVFTGGRYYDYFAAIPFLRGDGERPDSLEVLSIGAAAGTFERLLDHVVPGTQFDSVELDPAVVALAEAHFGGFPPGARVYTDLDGRVFAARVRREYDVLLVDAYERQIYIPVQVASREFFEVANARLKLGGIVALNVGGRGFEDPVVQTVGRTMASVFGTALAFRVPNSRNFMLLGRRDRKIDVDSLESVKTKSSELNAVLASMRNTNAWRVIEPGSPILTDDRPFLDRVQDAALRRSIGTPTLWAMDGDRAHADVTKDVYEALGSRDLDAVGDLLASSSSESALLRFYAGDWRWLQHDVAGARAEYLRARELGVSGDLTQTLDGRIEDVEGECARLEAARAATASNGWVALASVVVLLAVFGVAFRFAAAGAIRT